MVKLDMSQTHAMGKVHVGTLEIKARLEILKTLATLITHVLRVERVTIPICRVLSAVELKIHAMPTRHVIELGKYDMFAQLMRAGIVLQDT